MEFFLFRPGLGSFRFVWDRFQYFIAISGDCWKFHAVIERFVDIIRATVRLSSTRRVYLGRQNHLESDFGIVRTAAIGRHRHAIHEATVFACSNDVIPPSFATHTPSLIVVFISHAIARIHIDIQTSSKRSEEGHTHLIFRC